MGALRQRLKESAPELEAALEHSWKIALEQWLPAISTSRGSHSGAPHLWNVENHLDQVVLGFEQIPSCRDRMRLRPAEIYVLLSGVLFHDLGRVKGDRGHADASKTLLEAHYAAFGIPSLELARVLGQLVARHGPERDPSGRAAPTLHEVVLDPYGPLRLRPLGALIVLADCMDSAHTRAGGEHLLETGDGPNSFKALFRSRIRGIEVDHGAGLVRTVLSDEGYGESHAWEGGDKDTSGSSPTEAEVESVLDPNAEQFPPLAQWALQPGRDGLPPAALLQERFTGRYGYEPVEQAGRAYAHPWQDWGIVRAEPKPKPSRLCGLTWRDWCIIRGKYRVGERRGEDVNLGTQLALAMSDTRASAARLQQIRADLSAIGMPLAAWCIECQEHLYDTWGRETYEPIFDPHYLSTTADAMWSLATGVFGWSVFTYEELASMIGEPDPTMVRRAARRIAILAQAVWERLPEEDRGLPPLWTGEAHWRWNVHRQPHTCRCMTPEKVKSIIKRAEPSHG